MDFILKLKHWQIFLILLIASFTSNFTWVNHHTFNLVINTFGLIIYFSWYFTLGLELSELVPPRVELPKTLFIINGFVLILSIVIIIAVFNGHFASNGIIGFLWFIYLFFALFQFIFYPSKALKTVEKGTEASFGQYFKYFILILFWPIGIWWIQPKLNKVISENSNR